MGWRLARCILQVCMHRSIDLFVQIVFIFVFELTGPNTTRHDTTRHDAQALGSLRLEKGYRDYGHDMDNTDTLLQVRVGGWVGGWIDRCAVNTGP